jgi:hypothetical protein
LKPVTKAVLAKTDKSATARIFHYKVNKVNNLTLFIRIIYINFAGITLRNQYQQKKWAFLTGLPKI